MLENRTRFPLLELEVERERGYDAPTPLGEEEGEKEGKGREKEEEKGLRKRNEGKEGAREGGREGGSVGMESGRVERHGLIYRRVIRPALPFPLPPILFPLSSLPSLRH